MAASEALPVGLDAPQLTAAAEVLEWLARHAALPTHDLDEGEREILAIGQRVVDQVWPRMQSAGEELFSILAPLTDSERAERIALGRMELPYATAALITAATDLATEPFQGA